MKARVDVTRFGRDDERLSDEVVVETPLTIFVNGVELSTLLCSPDNLEYLVIGFLINESVIRGLDEIKEVRVDENKGVVKVKLAKDADLEGFHRRIVTSGCVGYYSKASTNIERISGSLMVSRDELLSLMGEMLGRSDVFKSTGGVHSSALCGRDKIIFFCEDIGRHNTVDKIVGYMCSKKISAGDKLLLTTGRLSSEMVLKAAKQGIPFVASRSAPTDLAVKAAKNFNMTLVGFVRGDRINVYSGAENIIKP